MDSPVAVGIDVGGTTVKGIVADEQGRVLVEVQARRTPHNDVPALLAVVKSTDATLRSHPLALRAHVLGTGVCVPGIVDEARGQAVFSANIGWRNEPLGELLGQTLGHDVSFGHDVASGALAEARWGGGPRSFLYVAIGTGIASAVVLDGRLTPRIPWEGEIGQRLVDDPDVPGRRCVLEEVASASGIARRAEHVGIINGAEGALEVFRLAEANDPNATEILRTSLDLIADTVATVRAQIGALDVVIGGGIANAGERDIAVLSGLIAERTVVLPTPHVHPAALGRLSQALGAAARVFEDHLSQSGATT